MTRKYTEPTTFTAKRAHNRNVGKFQIKFCKIKKKKTPRESTTVTITPSEPFLPAAMKDNENPASLQKTQ